MTYYNEVDCRKDLIEGMEAQLHDANSILAKYPKQDKNICVIGLSGTRVLYCQANFVFEFGKPFKFCRNLDYLIAQRYFEQLIETCDIDRLIFADRPTHQWFLRKPQFAPYRSLAVLMPNARQSGPDFLKSD